MNRFISLVVLATASLSLVGCADVVFKPGASAADMQRDETACRRQSPDEAGYDACMAERGYHLAKTEGVLGFEPASR